MCANFHIYVMYILFMVKQVQKTCKWEFNASITLLGDPTSNRSHYTLHAICPSVTCTHVNSDSRKSNLVYVAPMTTVTDRTILGHKLRAIQSSATKSIIMDKWMTNNLTASTNFRIPWTYNVDSSKAKVKVIRLPNAICHNLCTNYELKTS